MTQPATIDLFEYARQQRRNAGAPQPQNPCKVDAMPPPEAFRIRDVLADRRGRERAITAPDIAAAAGLWPNNSRAGKGTRAREIITIWYEHLQIPGHVLVAGGAGYYHTSDSDEAARYLATLRSRALNTLGRYRRVRIAAQAAGIPTGHPNGRSALNT